MTYYEVLEIDSSASTAEVERAFRRMARKVHPDLNAGDRAQAEARMKLLNEIRDTLTDPLLQRRIDPLELRLPDLVLDRLDRPDLGADESAHPLELLLELRLRRKVPGHRATLLPN